MSVSRRGLVVVLAVAATAGSQIVIDDRARASACVDGAGSPDEIGVAVDPATGGWCMDGVPINSGSRAEGLAMNVRAANAIVDDMNPVTADRWDYPGGIVNGQWDDGVGSGATRNTAELAAAFPSWASYGLDLVTVGLQGGNPRFECMDQTGAGRRVFSQYDDATDDLLPAAKDRLRTLITAAWEARIIVSVQLFYQNENDAEPDTDEEIVATIDNVTTWLEELATAPQGPSAPDGFQNIVIEVANEVVSDETYAATTVLDPASLADRVSQVHQRWPGALTSVNLGTSERVAKLTPEQNDAIHNEIDWVSLHANVISGTTLASRIDRARTDPELLGKPVVVTEDRWGHGESGDGPVLAPFDDAYDLNPNLVAAVDAGAGWGYYEQGCEAGEGDGSEEYDDADPGEPADNHYANGFQSLPVNWGSTSGEGAKQDFFTDVMTVTSSGPVPSPSPSPNPSPSAPPTGPVVRPLAAFHTGANGSSYTMSVPQPHPEERVLVVVGSTAQAKSSRVPALSGLGQTFSSVGQTSFQPASKVTTRMDALIGSTVSTSGGTLTLGFGATQADVHVVVMGVRDAGGAVSIGDVATATGSGTIGEISLDGASTSRTIVTVFHAVKEGSQPANGLTELADTAHGSRPSGMATAWSSAAFDPAPAYSWASASAWSGVAMEVMAATVQQE